MIVGVDPGLTGALAILDRAGALQSIIDMPVLDGQVSAGSLVDASTWWLPGWTAVVEDVHSMPGQGVASSFGFGRSKGVVEGVCAGAGMRLVYVAPSTWKRDLRLGRDKSAARGRAVELWPEHAGLFRRVKDDGRAEAALIGWWYCETLKRGGT